MREYLTTGDPLLLWTRPQITLLKVCTFKITKRGNGAKFYGPSEILRGFDSAVGRQPRYRGSSPGTGRKIFTFCEGSRLALGSAQSPVRWVPGAVMFAGMKWRTNTPKCTNDWPNCLVWTKSPQAWVQGRGKRRLHKNMQMQAHWLISTHSLTLRRLKTYIYVVPHR
jgi:hypothetical protein